MRILQQLSLQLVGTQIDAIYHTSLVFGGVEYYFGRGIQQSAPGTTHHGEPMEKLHLGRSEIPLEVIVEYMESLAQTYSEDVGIVGPNHGKALADYRHALQLVLRSVPPKLQ
jgi:hypothetical protein